VEVHVNTSTSLIAAYGILVTFDNAILDITASSSVAGMSTGFMSAANVNTNGQANVSGFDANGKGPSTDLGLFQITFAAVGQGTSAVNLQVNSFVDANTTDVWGSHPTRGGSVTVN
jgi:hypothetical protein